MSTTLNQSLGKLASGLMSCKNVILVLADLAKKMLANRVGACGDLHNRGRRGTAFSNIKLILESFLPLGTRLEAGVVLVS